MTITRNDVAPALIDAMVGLRPGGMTYRRTFAGRPDQIPRARCFIRFLLEDSPCRDDAEQIVAELAANAVAHTSSGQAHGTFIVELTRKVAVIRVTVYDCGWGGIPRFNRRREADPLAEHGRGLAVVAALASKVGCRGTQAVGHAVWAELSQT
ncbi:Anti-sigma regulatory factor (Ser/Thr protein kinase) [Streptosporangium subroseum]|uniref:Anti-sigma regulatory factor (Ser/Thr protein kinase) n=1 Tax=Streptosporangium subroseum TaxID=106412 RepID=A0A239BW42_9ACTN|nr:ATP-binding protein [Streptosporangium subroseum]SNS11383.1 Anti-sigma regulatory factor (Ser/Thr protein kinase) [Streptosporangium subroseum]